MKLISHRGLLNGPDATKENTPEQIDLALKEGYDVEVDVWLSNGQWFLGHNGPITKVKASFIKQKGLWLHCKNYAALESLSVAKRQLHYFWHQTDCYTITSKGIVWVYPSKRVVQGGVCVLPEEFMDIKDIDNTDGYYGICSDYVADIKEILK